MQPENLLPLKDDMIAFIEGHGMRRFPAMIPEDTPRVWWNDPENAESWKDFVEMAKAVGAQMICMGEDTIEKATLEMLLDELHELSGADAFGAEIEQANTLFLHEGQLGHIELAFAHQGVLFVHESVTGWYKRYHELVDTVDDLQELLNGSNEDLDGEPL